MTIDLVCLGRANLDLYSQDIGADFEDATGFDAMVGGSPTNIAIGASRLGLSTALLSAVGADHAGDFVLRYLTDENVDVSHVARIDGKLTSLALLGVKPPSTFPLMFYRDDPADIYLTTDDVTRFPLDDTRMIEISGNALSRGSCAEAAVLAASHASQHGVYTAMDLDLRPSEWKSPTAFGRAILSVAPHLDLVIGTEEEFFAVLMQDPDSELAHDTVPAHQLDELFDQVERFFTLGVETVIIKRGAAGATILHGTSRTDVPSSRIDVLNTVGAGDAFAAGLLRSRLRGLDWEPSVRFANACGALVVTRHGCSSALPTVEEVDQFMARYDE